MSYILPPDTSDTVISITIPKKIAPYFVAWYQATKQTGDTPSTFLIRMLKPIVRDEYKEIYLRPLRLDINTAIDAETTADLSLTAIDSTFN